MGALIETFAANECAAQASWSRRQIEVRHWRDTKSKTEVYLVLVDGAGRLVGVEVKAASVVRSEDLSGLARLAQRHPDRFVRGIVLYTGSRVAPIGDGCVAVPLSVLAGLAP